MMHIRFPIAAAVACTVICGAAGLGVTRAQTAAPPATNTVAPAIARVVAAGTPVTVIKEGFQGTEGPIALPDGSLIFTETAASRITKIDAQGMTSTFLEHSNGSNGLAFDPQGRIVSVQTVPGRTRVGVVYPPGAESTLAEGFPGRPNDLTVDRKGGVYFSVPGPSVAPGAAPPSEPFVPLVYYIPPGKPAIAVAEGIENPNGLLLSRDETTLYVNNTQGAYLLAFDVRPDGSLTNRRDFGKYAGTTSNAATGRVSSGADGLAIDRDGRLYAATSAGVQIFSSDGAHLGTIPVSRPPQNLAFAGPGKQTLYIVGRGAAYKVQMLVPGFAGRAK